MRKAVKSLLVRTGLYQPVRDHLYPPIRRLRVRRAQAKAIKDWEESGRPVPPPHLIKQRTLRDYAERNGLSVLVETGTYRGAMVAAMKDHFRKIYSIELSQQLYDEARDKFKEYDHIELIHGDSSVELGRVVSLLPEPALFWLDGHYSGGVTAKGEKRTPILEELDHVLSAPERRHVIVIDDARNFKKHHEYPTIDELREFVKSSGRDVEVVVADDMIRITPEPPDR